MRDDEKRKLHENIKQEIRSLLISSPKTKYGGLSGSLLYSDYKQLNSGKEVPYAELGFHSFLALLRSMPDVVHIEYKENSPSYRVHPVYNETIAHIQKMVFEQRDQYEHEHRLYNQNWHSNNGIQPNNRVLFNFNNNGQLPAFHILPPYRPFNIVETNPSIRFHHNTNNFLRRPFPQEMFIPNERRVACPFQPYLLITPPTPIEYRKQNDRIHFSSIEPLSSISAGDRETYSTPNTFIGTPPNFNFDNYHLNTSTQTSEKDIREDNNNNQISTHDDPLLTTSVNIVQDNPPTLKREESSSSISSKSILPPISDDVSEHHPLNNCECPVNSSISIIEEGNFSFKVPFYDKSDQPSDNENHLAICRHDEHKSSKMNENEKLLERINIAIRHCIDFRYIHRLCEVKFEHRYYPSSLETLLIKSQLERIALNDYKQELEEFEKNSQFNSSIDDQKCRMMFDQYVYLQRNYYYMIKLMKKTNSTDFSF